MTVDDIASIATALSAIVAACGVIVAASQLSLSRKISQSTFEDSLDQQYRSLAMQIPVDVLLGKAITDRKKGEVREIVYNYLDLCNEQVSLRVKRRVSEERWNDWEEGIAANMSKPAFREVWEEVKEVSPSTFSFLLDFEKMAFRGDPAKWSKGNPRRGD